MRFIARHERIIWWTFLAGMLAYVQFHGPHVCTVHISTPVTVAMYVLPFVIFAASWLWLSRSVRRRYEPIEGPDFDFTVREALPHERVDGIGDASDACALVIVQGEKVAWTDDYGTCHPLTPLTEAAQQRIEALVEAACLTFIHLSTTTEE